MKKFLTLFLMACCSIAAQAQSSGKISGKLLNRQKQILQEAATISLMKAADSSLVKMGITDSTGSFLLEHIDLGNYFIQISASEMSPYNSEVFQLSAEKNSLILDDILLESKPGELAAVTVNSRKKFIERKIDKTVINMDAAITHTGTTILEVLEKAPGVTVDKDGNISLRGKQSVIVMLDGKPTHMSHADLTNYLGGIPSSSLSQIELMTNPSAKYDASGNAGIINIITKKMKQRGFNGSLALAYGYSDYSKTNNSLNLNYRRGKVNLFSSLSGNYRDQYQHMDIYREYLRNDKTLKAIFDQETETFKKRSNYSVKLGADYYLNNKTTLGIVLTGYTAPGSEKGSSVSFLKNADALTDSIVTADRMEKDSWKDYGINFNLRKTLDTTGREFSVDLDFLQYDAITHQTFYNNTYQSDWSPKFNDILKGDLPRDIKIYMAKTDYTHPFKNGLKLEAGLKFSYVDTDNAADYFTVINGIPTIDYSKTNHFQYKENINAAYVNLNKTIKKWGLQVGLRAENSNYSGQQLGNPTHADSAFTNSYTNIFPTTYIQYTANEKNQWGFSLGRRISRPDYEDLNPFLFFLDKYTYEEGNVYLKPMYSNVFEVSHTYNQFLHTSLNYNHTTDMFEDVFRQNDQPNDSISTIITNDNFGKSDVVSLSIAIDFKPAKFWQAKFYTEGRYLHYQAEFREEKIDVENATFMFHLNNQFKIGKTWSAELSGFYMSGEQEGQININRIAQVELAVKKDILKKKGSLKLSVRDLFGPMEVDGNFQFGNTKAWFAQVRDSRVITLGFNYRFGKPIKGLKSRRSSTSDEQNRIGGN